MLALAGRILLYTVCGALLCALTGAFWGVACGGGLNLKIGPFLDPEHPNSTGFFQLYPGFVIGGYLGAMIGAVQGAVFFFLGGWVSSSHHKKLLHRRGSFWYLLRSVPLGQVVGLVVMVVFGATCSFVNGLFGGRVPRADILESVVSSFMWSSPLGVLLGGIGGGIFGLHLARNQRRREEKERPLPPVVQELEVGDLPVVSA